jgi:probable H4MPT-linked C1 transfer pathway protein
MNMVIGWDVGGAHLKAARAEHGRIVDAVQVASPLRLGLTRLKQSFAEAKDAIGPASRHVVTMTGELADTFTSRAEGVESLSRAAADELTPGEVLLYAGRAGFIAPELAARHVEDVASANWHASAALIGRRLGTALFMDMGSTTTDIVPVVAGAVAARGYTDGQRLAAGELVYTGLVRSFLMATRARAPFAGEWTGLIAENFANMADVHRVLGTLPDGADQMTTADGREKTVAASLTRAARPHGRPRRGRCNPRRVDAARQIVRRSTDSRRVRWRVARPLSGNPAARRAAGRRRDRAYRAARGGAPTRPPACGVREPARRHTRGARTRISMRAGRRARGIGVLALNLNFCAARFARPTHDGLRATVLRDMHGSHERNASYCNLQCRRSFSVEPPPLGNKSKSGNCIAA